MSRLPRLIEPRASWLRGLRAIIRRVYEQQGAVVVMPDTAGWQFVRRAAERWHVPVQVLQSTPSAAEDRDRDSPDSIPARDWELMEAADDVLALQVRPQGNVHRALCKALAAGRSVELIEGLSASVVLEELVSRGATVWSMPIHSIGPPEEVVERDVGPAVYELVPFPSEHDWRFLTHTTRACAGPWPGQLLDDYLDDLLDDHPNADHSALATLERILTQQRLISSGDSIRRQSRVVCFTEVPLAQLPDLHQFRTHRTRWDFNPYGICIQRDWLQNQGTRAVLYGDDQTWQGLVEEDRYLFQRAISTSTRAPDGSPLAWTIEREWRHLGDLDLSSLPADQGFVFVPTAAAARRIAAVSRWPVTLWPGPT